MEADTPNGQHYFHFKLQLLEEETNLLEVKLSSSHNIFILLLIVSAA